MARQRKYDEEYRLRIERGLAKGKTRAEARGHPLGKRSKAVKPKSDAKIETAVLAMNIGAPLTAAAKAAHVSPERLRYFIKSTGIGRRKGRKWAMRDNRVRQVQIISGSNSRLIRVRGFKAASKAAKHDAAYQKAVDSGEFEGVLAFKGKGVRDLKGELHLFETHPNQLYRYSMKDELPFHETYKIVAT